MKRTILIFFSLIVLMFVTSCEYTYRTETHYYLYDSYTGPVDVHSNRPDVDSTQLTSNDMKVEFQVPAGIEVLLADTDRIDNRQSYTRVILSDSVSGWVETRVIRPKSIRMVQKAGFHGYDTHLTRAKTLGEELTDSGSPIIGKIVLNNEFRDMFRDDFRGELNGLYTALAAVGVLMIIAWFLLTKGAIRGEKLFKALYISLWVLFIAAFAIEIRLGCVCDPNPLRLYGKGGWQIAFNFLIVIVSVFTLLFQYKIMPSLFSNLVYLDRINGIRFRPMGVSKTQGYVAVLSLLAFLMVVFMLVWKRGVDLMFWLMIIVVIIESIMVLKEASEKNEILRGILYVILLPIFFGTFIMIVLSFKAAIGWVFLGYAVIMGILSDPQGFFKSMSGSGSSSSSIGDSIMSTDGQHYGVMQDLGNGRIVDSEGTTRQRVSPSSNEFKKLGE